MSTTLVDACMQNREKAALTMIQAKNDVNAFDSRGFSPLIAAAHYGHYRMVKLLIRHGAAVDLANPESGRTALHHAAKEGHVDVVRLLIKKYGADIKKKDVAGRGCMHWACLGSKLEVVKMLIRYQAPLDEADLSGYTPLLTAVEYGRTEAADLLMRNGAKHAAQNNLKHNSLEIADWYGHKRLVETLAKKEQGETKSGAGEGDGSAAAAAPAPAPSSNPDVADAEGDTTMTAATPSNQDDGATPAAAADDAAASAS